MIALRDDHAATIRLGERIGAGGEGAVHAVVERPDQVAKIYVKPLPKEQVSKLEAMIGAGDESLRTVAAWPTRLLYSGTRPVGFTMPRLRAQHALHELFGPRTRQERFPNAHWRFLIHTSSNLARGFSVLHERGIVVGDVNSNNVVVGRDSTARFIDCDSFQFRVGEALYPCNVGVPDYQPPELQHADLSRVVRLPEHDLFGLAVIIFQLLFVGKHPFAGVLPPGVVGTGAIGANVAARRFFYHREASQRGLRPPPGSPTLAAVTPEMARLFTQAFLGAPERRPAADTWVGALADLERRTITCAKNPVHRHVRDAGCPWCELERHGLHYFLVPGRPRPVAYGVDESIWARCSNDDVERMWREISAVRAPALLPSTIAPSRRYVPTPLRLWSTKRRTAYAAGATAAVAATAAAIATGHAIFTLLILVAAGIGAVAGRPDARAAMRRLWQRESEARKAFVAVAADYAREARAGRFSTERSELAALRAQLLEQQRRMDHEIAAVRLQRAQRACFAHLAATPVAVDPFTSRLLRAAGITSAACMTRERLRGAAGLSGRQRAALLRWREDLEIVFFRRNPRWTDPKGERDVRLRHARARMKAAARLSRGAATLCAIAADIEQRRPGLARRGRELGEVLWQASADARVPTLLYKTWT